MNDTTDDDDTGFLVMHENENYRVLVSDELELVFYGNTYLGGYEVINKKSEVTEFMSTSLPEALYNAEQLNAALTSKAWEWRNEEKVASKKRAEDNPLVGSLN